MSKHRSGVVVPRSVGNFQRLALPGALCLLVASAGCEFVLGGIPRDRLGEDAGDDPTDEDAGRDAGSTKPDDDGGFEEPDSDVEGAMDADVRSDATTPGADDADVDAAEEDAEVVDARTPIDLDAYACDAETVWYRDGDGDGVGISAGSFTGCPRPAGSWALEAGDCNDENANVYPGQVRHFGVAYTTLEGTDSFDYDCSGMEEGNGAQEIVDSCGALELALCSSKQGYALTERTGDNVNQACGSNVILTCKTGTVLTLLVCQSTPSVATRPFVCR